MTIANICLFLGQSNEGNYSTIGVPYVGGWTPDPGILIWNPVASAWQVYNPLPGGNSSGDGTAATWGPEGEYARLRRLALPGVPVYIYKQWSGGVGLSMQPVGTDDWSCWSHGKQWDKLYSGFVACASNLIAQGFECVTDDCLFIGMETDTQNAVSASLASVNLQGFYRSISDKFGAPNMHFGISRVRLEAPNGPYAPQVRAAQAHVASLSSRFSLIDTDSLPFGNVSPGHYDPTGVITHGQLLFASYDS